LWANAEEDGPLDVDNIQSKPQPLWQMEGTEEEYEEDEDEEDLGDPDVGVLDFQAFRRHRSLEDDFTIECDEVNCDCSMWDNTALVGSFSCSYTYEDKTYNFSYDVTDSDNYIVSVEEVTGDTFYDVTYTYQAGEITACKVNVQGCPCECLLGICPDTAFTRITYCGDSLDLETCATFTDWTCDETLASETCANYTDVVAAIPPDAPTCYPGPPGVAGPPGPSGPSGSSARASALGILAMLAALVQTVI